MMLPYVFFVWLVTLIIMSGVDAEHHVMPRANPQIVASKQVTERACTCVPRHQCKIFNQEKGSEVGFKDTIVADGGCADSKVCCPSEATEQPKCGHRAMEDLVSDITQFSQGQALYGEFPWMVAVMGQQYVDNIRQTAAYYCGGSLIRPDVVLTAAHCVKGKKTLTVRVGEWSIRNLELFPVQNVNVKHVTIHEEYNAEKLHNDIALLFLESPVDLLPSVATICLPSRGENFDNQTCMTSGWGKDVFGGQYQDIMKKVTMRVVPHGNCEAQLHSTKLGEDFQLHDSTLCALALHGRDMCQGDGGSPLVCPTADRSSYVQAGVVSWGIGCGADSPGVYVSVAHFRNWIDQKLALLEH